MKAMKHKPKKLKYIVVQAVDDDDNPIGPPCFATEAIATMAESLVARGILKRTATGYEPTSKED